jgi:diacylglycerol O-acyltransferase
MTEHDRLRSVDTLWLDAERPGPSIAIGSINEVEGPAPTLDELRDFIESRIHLMPRLQQQLTHSSLRVKRPTWEHASADLTHHVQAIEVDAPGDDAALERAVAQIMETPLDFERPLWDAHLLTGLADGRFAIVTRMHHAVADGQGSIITLGHLLDTDPDGTRSLTDVFASAAPTTPASSRSTRSLVMDAAARGGDLTLRALRASLNPTRAASAVASSADDVRQRATDQVTRSAAGVRAVASPRIGSLIGGDPGQRRYWRTHQVALSDVKTIRSAFGATVNDVVMTLVSGGFATMMQRRGQDPTGKFLKVNIPVSVRAPGDMAANNQVTALFVQLPVSGPAVDRMKWIRSHINDVKDAKTADALQLIVDMLNVAPALIQTAAVRINGPFPEWTLDTLVTNVPGPPFPVYEMGRQVRRMMPLVALGRPLWCAVAVVSYDGELTFGISTGEGGEQAGVDVRDGIDSMLHDLLTAAATEGTRRGEDA